MGFARALGKGAGKHCRNHVCRVKMHISTHTCSGGLIEQKLAGVLSLSFFFFIVPKVQAVLFRLPLSLSPLCLCGLFAHTRPLLPRKVQAGRISVKTVGEESSWAMLSSSVAVPSGSYRAQKPPKTGNIIKIWRNTGSPTLGWAPKIWKNYRKNTKRTRKWPFWYFSDFFCIFGAQPRVGDLVLFFHIFFVFPALGGFWALYEPRRNRNSSAQLVMTLRRSPSHHKNVLTAWIALAAKDVSKSGPAAPLEAEIVDSDRCAVHVAHLRDSSSSELKNRQRDRQRQTQADRGRQRQI